MTNLSPEKQAKHLEKVVDEIVKLGYKSALQRIEGQNDVHYWQIVVDDCPVNCWRFDAEYSRGVFLSDQKPTGRYRFLLQGFGYDDPMGRHSKSLTPRKDGTYNYEIIAEFVVANHKYWQEINARQAREKDNRSVLEKLRQYPGYPAPGLVCTPSRTNNEMLTVRVVAELPLGQVQRLVEILRYADKFEEDRRAVTDSDGPGDVGQG